MLAIERLEKTYAARKGSQPVRALRGVNFDVARGDFFALLGPSGCGKTTILQSIAGLETPDSGTIRIGDRPVFDAANSVFLTASQRMLGMVFQSYAIWPHMTVFDNVAFPLVHGRDRKPREEVRKRVMTALARVKLESFADRLAPHLSGGQQQRVAIARAIVHEPRLLLLDEPLSNLDARLRDTMREELRQIVKSLGITTIFVTHDQVEAMGMADRIAVINHGEIMQIGSPSDVYFSPKNAFVANFVGRSNTISGRVTSIERAGAQTLRRVATPIGEICSTADSAVKAGDEVRCIIRPQAFSAPAASGEENIFEGVLTGQTFLGDFIDATIAVGNTQLCAIFNSYDKTPRGSTIRLAVPFDRCVVVPAD